MTTQLTAEQRAVLESIDPQAFASFVGKANRADTEVRVNDEDNRKFGDVSIYKVQKNGFARPKLGVYTDNIPELIEGLQKAYDQLVADDALATE